MFLAGNDLHEQFINLLGTTDPKQVVHMCGSGVTACHNLLAMEYAGLSGSKLYAGSWSEWITNANRPITGA
jgi:thiosulfate/3-mercaptopyruvate sulfurtransferase